MIQPPMTILESMTRPIPQAPSTRDPEGRPDSPSTTRNSAFFIPKWIFKWKDFKESLTEELFDGQLNKTLNERLPGLKDCSRPSSTLLNYALDHDSVELLLQATVAELVQQALEVSSHALLGQRVQLVRGKGKAVCLLYDNVKNRTKRFEPDWGCKSERQNSFIPEKHKSGRPPPTASIMPGDSKWRDWNSSMISSTHNKNGKVNNQNKESLWPIRQVLTYSVHAHARYGFLITPDELVALRFSYALDKHIPDVSDFNLRGLVSEHGVVEWASIPWKTNPKSNWTMSVALYVLIVLAGNNGQLVEKDSPYPPLRDERLIPVKRQPVLLPLKKTQQEAEDQGVPGRKSKGSRKRAAEEEPYEGMNTRSRSRTRTK